jgi:DNA-binding LacI/PurR family transcriptional regulator
VDKLPETIFNRLKIGSNADCSIASQIADQIRWLIVTNEVRPGEKLPSVRGLAEYLNINFHTVRAAYRLLEESNLIFTRQGQGSTVIEYSSSTIVSNNTTPTHTFGIIVPDLRNPFYPSFLNGAAYVASQHNVLVITCDTQEQIHLGKAFFEMLITKRVDGMLISPFGVYPDPKDQFSIDQFYDFPIPLVFVDRPNVNGYSVLLDARGAGYKSTQHLIDHGHKKIAILTGNRKIPTLNECYRGYLSALEENGLQFDEHLVVEVNEFSYHEGYQAAVNLIQKGLLPSAIFAAGDMLAIGAMKALRENGIRIPEDVAFTGYNDIDVSNYVSPALTSVSTPVRQMGEESTKLLLKLVSKQPVSRQPIVMDTTLVIRESCGCRPEKIIPHLNEKGSI